MDDRTTSCLLGYLMDVFLEPLHCYFAVFDTSFYQIDDRLEFINAVVEVIVAELFIYLHDQTT